MSSSDNFTTVKPGQIPVWEDRLILLSDGQRSIFGAIVGILFLWSVVGNILTFFVNVKRLLILLITKFKK